MAAQLPALEHHVPGDEKSLVVVPLAAGEGAAKVYTFGACCVSYVYAGVEQLAARADTKWTDRRGSALGSRTASHSLAARRPNKLVRGAARLRAQCHVAHHRAHAVVRHDAADAR